MDRREFITWMGIGGLATSLPLALAACAPETTADTPATDAPATDAPAADANGSNIIGTVADLEANGFVLKEDASVGPVLVVGTVASLSAVNPTCTHKGCTVTWSADNNLMICPCHDSRFNIDGTVAKGPASEPLAVYTAQIDGDNIVVN